MATPRPRTCLPLVRPSSRTSRPVFTLAAVPVLAALAVLAVVAVLVTATGCSDDATTPRPSTPGVPQANFAATLDPSAETFVLTRIPSTQPGQTPAEVELIGSNLVIHPSSETVWLDVAVRNASPVSLPVPAQVWLGDFDPAGVTVLNADFVDPPIRKTVADTIQGPVRYGFDYSSLVGPDGELSPGETSQVRTWEFQVPGLVSFSFAAVATFGGGPGGPVIAGLVFHDLNGNGVREPGEPPFFGWITVRKPDGSTAGSGTMDGGMYSLPVQDVGLHTLTYEPPPLDCLCEVVSTTPNPLQVVLLPDDNGQPVSYLHADFGARILRLDEPRPVVLTDLPPDEIRQDPYQLIDISLADPILTLRVSFSGCGPFHDFTLFVSGGFMESDPVRARLVLGHDNRGEDCLAVFQRTLEFDLTPLREAFEHAYGRPGPVLLQFTDLQGNHHEFLYSWGPPPGQNLLPNGSFEQDGQPTLEGWEVVNPALTSVVPADAPGGGSWALRLQADWAPTTGLVRAPVAGLPGASGASTATAGSAGAAEAAASAGQTLRLSAWVRADGVGGGGTMYLTTGSWTSPAVSTEAPVWTPLQLIATPPVAAGDTLWVVLSSLHTEILPRFGLFDGVVLEALAAPADSMDSNDGP